MSRKNNKKSSNWSSKGGGMRKHRISGVAHNHAISIANVREMNAKLDAEREKRERLRQRFLENGY